MERGGWVDGRGNAHGRVACVRGGEVGEAVGGRRRRRAGGRWLHRMPWAALRDRVHIHVRFVQMRLGEPAKSTWDALWFWYFYSGGHARLVQKLMGAHRGPRGRPQGVLSKVIIRTSPSLSSSPLARWATQRPFGCVWVCGGCFDFSAGVQLPNIL